MAKDCSICGKKLSLLNWSEYTVGDGEKICSNCRGKILEILEIEDPLEKERKESREDVSKYGKDVAALKDLVQFGSKLAKGTNVKDAISGVDASIQALFSMGHSAFWRQFFGLRDSLSDEEWQEERQRLLERAK